jgi:hypothetical protein
MNSSLVERKGHWGLFAVTALLYLRALPGEFVWDDRTFFVENDILPNLAPWDLKALLLQPASYWGENLPLSEFLFALEYQAFGSFTPAYHAVSLALYLAIGVLAWRFAGNIYREFSRSSRGGGDDEANRRISALFVTSLFLLHPVHVEVVAYITAQQHLLYALFSLLSIDILWTAWTRGELHRARSLAPAMACYYLAVLAKYQAVATGLFIPLLWLVSRRRGDGDVLKVCGCWALVNIPVALWLRFSTAGYGDVGQTDLPLLEAVLRGIRILGAHLLIALKPHPLNFGYPFDLAGSFDLDFAAGALVLGGLAASLAYRRRSIASVGLLIFVVYLFPVLQIFVEVSNAAVYDRYLFLPVLGLCLIAERCLAAAANRWIQLRWAVGSLALALTIALALATVSYIPKFGSNLASMEHAHRSFPGWKRAAFDYEDALIEAGSLDEAEEIASREEAFRDPVWVRSYFLGRIELERGNLAQAISQLERASRLIHQGGYFPFTGVPLGRAFVEAGEWDRARLYLQDVLASPIHQPIQQFRAKRLLAEIADRGVSR